MLMKHISIFCQRSFHHSSTLDRHPRPKSSLNKTTVTIESPGRSVSVPGADESWMDNLSAAEVLQQYGYDPNVILTSEGKLVLPDGGDAEPTSSDKSDDSSSSDDDLPNPPGKESSPGDRRKLLKVKLK